MAARFQTPKWDSAIHDHDDMLKALEARDGKRLSAILRQHLLDNRDAVLQVRSREDVAAANLKA
jgi:DNA-binding GntR family transcriptional regulator